MFYLLACSEPGGEVWWYFTGALEMKREPTAPEPLPFNNRDKYQASSQDWIQKQGSCGSPAPFLECLSPIPDAPGLQL